MAAVQAAEIMAGTGSGDNGAVYRRAEIMAAGGTGSGDNGGGGTGSGDNGGGDRERR